MKHLAYAVCAAALAACSTNPAPTNAAANSVPAAERTQGQNADIAALQGVTRVLIDSSSLYSAAAHDSQNQGYTTQLEALSDRRRTMTNNFQARVASLGGNPAETGQPLGTAQRALMEARTLGDQDTKVAVQEALRGEEYLLGQLREEAGNMDLSANTRAFLSQQIPMVVADRDRLRVYADSLG